MWEELVWLTSDDFSEKDCPKTQCHSLNTTGNNNKSNSMRSSIPILKRKL